DMAPFIFTKKILDGDTIDINNNGDMWRDFTHVDDIVEGVVRIADVLPTRNESWTVEAGTPAPTEVKRPPAININVINFLSIVHIWQKYE
ncbi:NAD-dependent epimerase/dehydratase family protein, partial [Escherichia coli]|uniref:NAD-dependent epimerase/dehydratase family protein n=1 Tax=Escherichia coli TaxID=562 RepID=UPI0028DF150E